MISGSSRCYKGNTAGPSGTAGGQEAGATSEEQLGGPLKKATLLRSLQRAGRAKVIHGLKRRSLQAEAGKYPNRENGKEPMWKKQLKTEGEHKVTDSTGLHRDFNSNVYVNNLRMAE